jgi:predicted DNA repair protein MutK
MPELLAALSVIGMAAMLWVGGHILLEPQSALNRRLDASC